MKEIVHLFTPNKVISKSAATILIGLQTAVFFIFWVYSPFVFLPTVGETFHSFIQLWNDGLAVDLLTSFFLNLQAILFATLVSLLMAYATVLPFFRPVVSVISKLRFLSPVGLTFFFMLGTGGGHELKLSLLVFSISIFFITGMADVLNSIPKVQYDLARTLRMGGWREVWEIVIIGQTDKVFDVLRQNAAIGFMMLTMVEGLDRSGGGVGSILLNQNKHFHLSAILAIQITILLVGLLQDYAIGTLRNIVCPYANLTVERK